MSLLGLPAELLLHIETFLEPHSAFQFALAAKYLHTLFSAALAEHGRLFSEYRVIDTANAVNTPLLWHVLEDVLHDPRTGWYVRELNVVSNRQYLRDVRGRQTGVMGDALSDEDQAMFIAAARALADLYPAEILGGGTADDPGKSWAEVIARLETRIKQGYDDAIIAILVHQLPNLQTIRITDNEMDCVDLMMKWIAATYKDPARASRLPLQHLKHAYVAHWDTELGCDPDWACYFLSVPSLKGFAASAMVDDPSPGAMQIYNPEFTRSRSKVKDLLLDRCVFLTEGLKAILSGVGNLQSLAYTDGGATVSDSGSYHPKRIIEAIGDTVGHSLENLVLNQSHWGDVETGVEFDAKKRVSFDKFKKLKALECEWYMLSVAGDSESEPEDEEPLRSGFYNEDNLDEPDVFDARNLLPSSLREFKVLLRLEDPDLERAVALHRVGNTATPDLEHIRFERKHMFACSDCVVDVIGKASPLYEIHTHPLGKLAEGHAA